MAANSSESLWARVEDARDDKPRTFTRDDIIWVHESSPREPYLSFTIGPHPLRRLIIKIWSHDQGWCKAEYKSNQPYANSHTWFALGIVPESPDPLLPPDEPYLCEIQRNVRASFERKCHVLEWRLNTPIEEDQSDENEAQGWLESISSASRVKVGVFPLARYAGWKNVVYRVEVELYDNSDTTPLPATGPTARMTYSNYSKKAASPTIDKDAMRSLTAEIEEAQGVLDQTPSGDPDIAVKLDELAFSLSRRYEQTSSIEDLARGIEAAQKAFEALTHDDSRVGTALNSLGIWLVRRYHHTQSRDDLTRGIEVAQESIKATPNEDPHLAQYLSNLGQWVYCQYEQTQSMDDLSRSIEVAEQVIKVAAADHPRLAVYLHNVSFRLHIRYRDKRSVEDLMSAIKLSQKAVEAASDDHPMLAQILDNLADCLAARYNSTRRIDYLTNAIEALERTIKMLPDTHPVLASCLIKLGAWLRFSFEATGSMKNAERAIEVSQRAIEIIPEADYENLAKCLSNLGRCLSGRSHQTHSTDEMDKAIEITERAIAMLPENHPHLGFAYDTLGTCLSLKSDLIGSTDILTRAIGVQQKAVEVTHNYLRPTYLNHLGQSLAKRHGYTGSKDDLTKAIETIQKATGAASSSQSDPTLVLTNLAACFISQYKRSGSEDDLAKVIETTEKAVGTTPHYDKTLATKLNNLSVGLGQRYDRTGAMGDLARSIEASQKAVLLADSSTLATCLMNLGKSLRNRYVRAGSKDDLMRAILALQKSVKATPQGHSHQAYRLWNLGDLLGLHYAVSQAKSDQDYELSVYVRACHCTTSRPSDRIRSAKRAARIYSSRKQWDEAYHLLRDAVLLLPKVSTRSLNQPDMQNVLSPTSGLATDTAAIAINAGKSASEVLSILELGRGVIASLLIDTRGDVSNLKEKHPSLADSFVALLNELDLPSQDSGSTVELSAINRRHQASREFDEVIEQIRTQDGFHDFLQPPPAESLMAAAKSGPIVVINVSLYRCDAILVECERVRLLELPEFTPEKFPEFDRDVSDFKYNPWRFLEWLWTTICRPCLNALGFTEALGGDAQWPHIWWIPTNSFSQFPLHAAGIYAPGSKETVLDRVVSSYASSIKALQHGRQRRRELMDEKNQQNAAIIVAMEETEGQMSLPNAKTETDKVRTLCQSLNLEVTTPPRRKADILEHLKKCRVLHFAGHGESKADPSQSCLLLDDWQTSPLTVGHLRQSWLKESPAFLAYLSACSTGSNQGGRLSDEAIHLVSAFQLAGFRHVVGTLWEVSDPHCVDVATILYQTLCEDGMTDEAVSYGLHRALRKLRDDSSWGGTRRDAEREDKRPTEECSLNTYWIPFVHFGA